MRSAAILLSNLRAEGGPALAADLCGAWVEQGVEPHVLLLNDRQMEFEDRFRAVGVDPVVLGVPSISPKNYPAIIGRIHKALRARRVEGILSIPTGVHGAIFAGAVAAGVKNRAVHVGTYPWHWQKSFWKFRFLMHASAPLTPDLVCVSEHVRSGVEEHYRRVAQNVHVIPNGIDVDRFQFRKGPRERAADEPLRILMVGRLGAGKDHPTLVRAIGELARRGVPVQLDLAGDGSRVEEMKALAAENGVADSIRFLGARKDVPELLAQADLFAFSVRPEEGLGIALVEAMAAGVPIVATDVGACREVLDGGTCGLLTEPKNPNAIADAVEKLAADPDLGRRLVLAARKRAESTYSRREMARRYAALCGVA